jgi:hypothetical protein
MNSGEDSARSGGAPGRSGDGPGQHRAAGASGIRLTVGDRVIAWLVTGPVGRLVAFVADLGAAWWSWVRNRG